MAEFERPRARALSDAELARALQSFPSDAIGLEAASKLIAEQQQLRIQDSLELQAWIEYLRERDDEQSRQILAESIANIFPPEHIAEPEPKQEPALLTSELAVITRKSKVASRLKGATVLRLSVLALLLALVNSLAMEWLELEGLSAVLALAVGIPVAFVLATPLRRHLLHPVLRAAAVFGGRGVYVFGGLALGITGTIYVVSFQTLSQLHDLAFLGPYSAVLIVMVTVSSLIGQLVPVRFGPLLVAVPTVIGLGFLSGAGFSLDFGSGLQSGWIWGAVSAALLTTTVLIFGTPHAQITWQASSALAPSVLALSIVFGGFASFSFDLAFTFAIAALFIALAYSGRDLAGGVLGRFAGLAMLIGLALSPLTSNLTGVVLSILSASATLMLLDQLARTSALHIPSLDTSYGFYGSFAWFSWLTLALAGPLGTPFVTAQLPDVMNHLEWSFVLGASLGVLAGIARIPTVRRQDSEIKNLDSSSGNIANLLGL